LRPLAGVLLQVARRKMPSWARLSLQPAAQSPPPLPVAAPGLCRSNINEFIIELPAPLLAYSAWPKPFSSGKNATFEEVGVNSAGVAISDTETIFNRNNTWRNATLNIDPYMEKTGLTEDALTTLLLPSVRGAWRRTWRMLAKSMWTRGNMGLGHGMVVLWQQVAPAWHRLRLNQNALTAGGTNRHTHLTYYCALQLAISNTSPSQMYNM
jgi:hypothetical protein